MGKLEEGPSLWTGRASADALLWRGGESLWVGGGDKDMNVVRLLCFARGWFGTVRMLSM